MDVYVGTFNFTFIVRVAKRLDNVFNDSGARFSKNLRKNPKFSVSFS